MNAHHQIPPVAVVGLSCLYPGVNSPQSLWESVLNKQCFVRPLPEANLPKGVYSNNDHLRNLKPFDSLLGAVVDTSEIKTGGFRIPPKDLERADKSHAIMLHLTVEALKDYNRPLDEDVRKNIPLIFANSGLESLEKSGVFIRRHAFLHRLRPQLEKLGWDSTRIKIFEDEFAEGLKEEGCSFDSSVGAIGSIIAAVPGRVAMSMGFGGGHHSIDAACASSIMATRTASMLLATGKYPYVIVGGFDLMLTPFLYMGFHALGALSSHGSYPFDDRADGLIHGEGAGVMILRRLDDALESDDKIQGVIQGIGTSSDGRGKAIYSPDSRGIVQAMDRSFACSNGLKPEDIQYLEAHATGTPIGDSTEWDAISRFYGPVNSAESPLRLTGNKEQWGHTRAASFFPGLIRVLKGMDAKKYPFMFSFQSLNKRIQYKGPALKIVRELEDWPEKNGARTAAINNFGFGGINGHAIVQKKDHYAFPENGRRHRHIFPLALVAMEAKSPLGDKGKEVLEKALSGDSCFQEVDPESDLWKIWGSNDSRYDRFHGNVVSKDLSFDFDSTDFSIAPRDAASLDPSQQVGMILGKELKLRNEAVLGNTPKDRIATICGYMINHRRQESIDMLWHGFYISIAETCPSFKDIVDEDILKSIISKVSERVINESPLIQYNSVAGWMMNTLTGWVSKANDFRGPNYTCDSACSSSASALLNASLELNFGFTDAVIWGGFNTGCSNDILIGLDSIKALSKDYPRPYCHKSQGFIVGNGGILCVLKRYDVAQKAGDPIIAVIEGVGMSCEAGGLSLLSASSSTIRQSIFRAFENASPSIQKSDIDFIEGHGGGTSVGDRAEIEAFFMECSSRQRDPIRLTAAKSYLGHVQGGSMAMSLWMAVTAARYGIVPPIQRFEHPRETVKAFIESIIPLKESFQLPRGDKDLIFGVNSLGLGGTSYFTLLSMPRGSMRHSSFIGGKLVPITDPAPRRHDPSKSEIFFVCAEGLSELSRRCLALSEVAHPSSDSYGSSSVSSLAFTYKDIASLKTRLRSVAAVLSRGKEEEFSALAAQGIHIRASARKG